MEELLERHPANPIVVPGTQDWRRSATFNPGVIFDGGRFYMLERASGNLRPFKCQIGLLESTDGIRFKLASDKPVFTPEELLAPQGTIEDPRIVKIDDVFYMSVAFRPFTYLCLPTGRGVPDYLPQVGSLDKGINHTRSGIARSRDLKQFEWMGFTSPPEMDDRNNVLFPEKIAGRFALLRRPGGYHGPAYGCSGPSIWISYSEDLKTWTPPELLAQPENEWEGGKIGASAPPLKTSEGWLMFYHGVDNESVYRVGIMLLDLENPNKILARSPYFVLEPRAYYERFGLVIPNVIFPTGNVEQNGTVFLYYGCCDTSISLAQASLKTLLGYVKRFPRQHAA